MKKTYPVVGMHCASCAVLLERKFKKTAGVLGAVVNFGNEKAFIDFNEKEISEEKLFEIAKQSGYSLIFGGGTEKAQELVKEVKRKNLNETKQKAFISLLVSIYIIFGSMPDIFRFWPTLLGNSIILFILTAFIQFWAGQEFYLATLSGLRNRNASMDTLISIGTTAAFIVSTVLVFGPMIFPGVDFPRGTYFDTSTVIIGLILLGRYLEGLAKLGTNSAISKLMDLEAKTARVIREGKDVDVSLSEVVTGDTIRVRPGEKVPVDGEVIEGSSFIDESMISGESIPVTKVAGSSVIGSTINKSGAFIMKASRVGNGTVLARIIKLVEDAQGSKAGIQNLADVVSSYFVPVVIIISIVTFVLWFDFGPIPSFLFAFLNMVAVLVIACPCALGLATPTSVMVGVGKGAENGILIKDAESLENLERVKKVVFDKTGTLTNGKPIVTDVVGFLGTEEDILRIAGSLEQGSEHPLGQAICEEARQRQIKLSPCVDFQAVSGKGVIGKVDAKECLLGNRLLASDRGIKTDEHERLIESLEDQGKTVVILAVDGIFSGLISIADTLKESSMEAILLLKRIGIEVFILSGDNRRTALAVGRSLGLTDEQVLAPVLPEQKEEEIGLLKSDGRLVAMVGDGINDAPALALSDVGIAVGNGTDVAIESANIILVNKDLRSLVSAIRLSQATMRTIRINLFFAFFYNIILIPVAMGILYPISRILLSPMLASFAMAVSSISVVGNSLLLKKVNISIKEVK